MLYFDCHKSEREKRDNPWEFVQHASDDGRRTLCGRRIKVETTWTRGSGRADMCCAHCLKKMTERGLKWM